MTSVIAGCTAECRVGSVEWEVWSVEYRVLCVECQVSSVECRVWNVEWGVQRVQCKVWSVECRVYNVECVDVFRCN